MLQKASKDLSDKRNLSLSNSGYELTMKHFVADVCEISDTVNIKQTRSSIILLTLDDGIIITFFLTGNAERDPMQIDGNFNGHVDFVEKI